MSAAGLGRLMVAVDAAAAALLAVVWVAQVRADAVNRPALEAGALLLALGASLPFAVRRRAPRWVFGVMAACFGIALLVGTAATGAGVAFAAYTVLVRHDRRVGSVVVVVGYALIGLAHLTLPDTTLSTFFLDAVTFAMVIALAELVRTRRAYTELHEQRAAQLERERISLAQRAVDEERLRIARELHDVVAHTITLIAVQSSVGLDRIRTEPDAAAQALGTIETSSRAALAEMRRMLAILRRDDDGLAQLDPSSGLSDLPALLREMSGIGVPVQLVVGGERPPAVPSGVDLCGYRIVQEALTNVVKHAPGASAVVSVHWQADGIGLEVTDDGHGRGLLGTSEGEAAGHGLLGMRERVGLFGGSFAAGPRTSGGFGIRVHLPFERTSPRTRLATAIPRQAGT